MNNQGKQAWQACSPQGQWGWTVFGPDGLAANVHTGEVDAKRFAASTQLLEACEMALGLLWEEQARLDSPTPFDRTVEQLEAAIRAAMEG